jgi:tetratricopeptide (TPR) repeat protein
MATIKKRAYGAKKQPEQEIVTIAHKVSGVMQANKKVVNAAVSVFAVVLILVSGYMLMKSRDEQKAAPLLDTAYKQYKSPAPDYAKSLELFRDVQKKYPSSFSGAIASFYVANCLTDLGRNEEALKEYQAFINKYSRDSFLLGLVYDRMGYLYLSMGKRDDAVKAFELSDSLFGPGIATVELAKLYEAAGNGPESQKKYKVIADKLAGTAWAREATGKIQKIESLPASVPDEKKKDKNPQ